MGGEISSRLISGLLYTKLHLSKGGSQQEQGPDVCSALLSLSGFAPVWIPETIVLGSMRPSSILFRIIRATLMKTSSTPSPVSALVSRKRISFSCAHLLASRKVTNLLSLRSHLLPTAMIDMSARASVRASASQLMRWLY